MVISREDDVESNAVIDRYAKCGGAPFPIRKVHVSLPGFLPPVVRAIDSAQGDVLALMDDDAEAHVDWLARISSYYSDPRVGGVGGRCVNYFHGVKQDYPPVRRVAKLCWYGRSIGNMYRDCVFSDPVDADFLMGGNSSYRLDVLRNCKPDSRLGNNVAFHWEMDVGLQVKKCGYRIIFDPAIKVDHHSAPRDVDGMRTVNYDGVYWGNYNYALLMKKHLTALGFVSYVLYSLAVGWGGSPGFTYVLYSIMRGRNLPWREMLIASVRGRMDGIKAAPGS